ncbi:quinol oxidase [Noviherbaspirillum sedimenti]|uniref:Quinol oxidase n=1 Tax=Noviherbaspirillum sedimenti TaxID=2320865 RepID=A0A3A3G0M2_9BURK|nr:quinol oxidase [Noviherbaspirillum sedimenti]RJG01983.1 quinol oxidase [Noviherbaspirillum sedimenti]
MKPAMFARCCAIAIAMLAFGTSAAGPDALSYQASRDADGVQRVALVGGNYFFRPEHIVAQAGQPLEISVKVEPGVVPHSFVLEAADGTSLADVKLGEEAQTLRFNLTAGKYVFYCSKRLLGFKSHRERGMAGVLEVRE